CPHSTGEAAVEASPEDIDSIEAAGWESNPGPEADHLGPCFRATLAMLEWPLLATTKLEVNFTTALDFGGINTVDSARALTRANKGGVCTPGQLRAVASLVTGIEKLRKQARGAERIQVAGRVNDALGPDGPIWPLLESVSSLLPQPSLARAITSAIDEENQVMGSP
ncbi:uncharacterized protein HaLaN_19317, partial [Haematococcus lacustris]